MIRPIRRILTLALCAALLIGALPIPAAAEQEETREEKRPINFLTYEQALNYFDFDQAARNWCNNFGMDQDTQLQEAKKALLAGTDRELIIRLATFSRDTGHGGEKLVVNNGFRPACYQEVIGLHDSNGNTGPYRNAMTWNGRSVTKFWWTAEQAAGWPYDYAIDLSEYDIATLDLSVYYRAALRLWDNGWVSSYYARPGCSAHNSGTAMDIGNYWIATNFATSYTYNGQTFNMADYGIYKPLQPTATSAGETWHITCSPEVYALGNYDHAFQAGFEVVYTLYYNPAHRGWSMADGRGVYLGAGVTVLQIRLCQLGLLDKSYITGYYCTKTAEAVRAFQASKGLEADGVCGAGTMALLLPETQVPADSQAPELTYAEITSLSSRGFRITVEGRDDQRLNSFRVDTLKEDGEVWVTRYYNAPASGRGVLDVDLWEQGAYQVRVAACDAAGNESPLTDPGGVFVDTTPPVLRRLTVSDIREDGFTLAAWAEDNVGVSGFRVALTNEQGVSTGHILEAPGYAEIQILGLPTGTWTITVTAIDVRDNESAYTFAWKYTQGAAQEGRTVTHYG